MTTPIHAIESNDPIENPWRVALVRPDGRPAVRETDEKYVMTFPHLIVRELILFEVVTIALSLAAIAFDAPLESIANPLETPNPAKAPWYFLGLQELLHYFPPVVAGVLLPTLVAIALIVIPYARVNMEGKPLWSVDSPRKRWLLGSAVLAVVVLMARFSCWPIVVPTALVGWAMFAARRAPERQGWLHRLRAVTLPEWIMTWFVVVAATLTIIGTFFRGPGWSWVWPWTDAPRG
jgi:quinol-cytochrome oxidoreductase complex cytochrome b subunit